MNSASQPFCCNLCDFNEIVSCDLIALCVNFYTVEHFECHSAIALSVSLTVFNEFQELLQSYILTQKLSNSLSAVRRWISSFEVWRIWSSDRFCTPKLQSLQYREKLHWQTTKGKDRELALSVEHQKEDRPKFGSSFYLVTFFIVTFCLVTFLLSLTVLTV